MCLSRAEWTKGDDILSARDELAAGQFHHQHLVERRDHLEAKLSSDHVHIFVSVPPKLAISDLARKMKGRSSYNLQHEFPAVRKRYWGYWFWRRRELSTTNGAITEDIVLQYIETHIADAAGVSR